MKEPSLQLVAGLIGLPCVARLAFLYYRLPAIWRGRAGLPDIHARMLDVLPRSYLTFVLYDTAFLGGLSLICGYLVFGGLPVLAAGLVFLATAPIWTVLHWRVNSVNRPSFLVPPSRRGEPGRWVQRRQKRERRAAGQPLTDHLVEIVKVSGTDPLTYANCTDDDCGFMEYPGDDALDPEQNLREQIARHTTKTPAVVQVSID